MDVFFTAEEAYQRTKAKRIEGMHKIMMQIGEAINNGYYSTSFKYELPEEALVFLKKQGYSILPRDLQPELTTVSWNQLPDVLKNTPPIQFKED